MISEFVDKIIPFFDKKQKVSNSIPGVMGADKVNYILDLYNHAVDYVSEEIDRSFEMWNLYSGIDDSQYPEKIRDQMAKENRSPFQGNFIRSKVDGLAGSIIKNFFDINFEPINGEYSDLTRYMKELMLLDKELLDWKQSYRELVLDGLVHLGVEEMYVSDRYNPLGNIGFRRNLPGHVLLDPDWLTNNGWDLKRLWKTAYLRPDEIKDIYNTKADEIEEYIQIQRGIAQQFDQGSRTKGVPYPEHNEVYTDRYRVIEYHHIEKEKRKVEVTVASGLVVPEGPDELKKEWAILNNVDLSDGVMTREEKVDTYYITTICPALSRYLVLEDKKALIQIGRLPFFPWSCARINGKNSGIPDLLKSVQRTYNYRESMLDYSISTSANGAHVIDPNIFDNDQTKMDELSRNWNKPSFKMYSAPGAISSGREFIKEVPRSNVDYGVVNELTRMIEIADMISKQPAAMDARSEGSEETGILYARKQMQAEITQTMLTQGLEQHENEKGEAYFLFAKQFYSGVYRDFYILGTNEKIELNKPTITPSGEIIENDISTLPRMKVIVDQSPEGLTIRSVDRAINTEILRVIGEFSPINRALAVRNVMKTLNMSKEDKKLYEEAGTLEYLLALENTKAQILQTQAAQLTIQNQLGMVGQPQQGTTEQQGEPPREQGNPEGTLQGNLVNAGTPQ